MSLVAMYRLTALAIIASILLSHSTYGFWILSHHPLTSQQLDPIVAGNNLSSHVHTFVGSAAILGDKQNDTCTTAEVKADKSRYWAPQLYYYSNANRTFSTVPLSFVNTYYLNRASAGTSIQAFPFGLRMIAGNASSYNSPLADPTAASAISFVCLNYQAKSSQSATLPNVTCPDGLRTQIVFPSCWNGRDLDSDNHQSHMAYPLGGHPDNGDCPTSHPIKFMTLFYEFIWSVANLTANASPGTLLLANGDTIGYSFHADFISGWDVDVLQEAIDQCTGALFGDLKSCPPFVKSYQQESKQDGHYCTADTGVANARGLASLPGNNVIRNGIYAGRGQGLGASAGPASPRETSTRLNSKATKSMTSHRHTHTSKGKSKKKKGKKAHHRKGRKTIKKPKDRQ